MLKIVICDESSEYVSQLAQITQNIIQKQEYNAEVALITTDPAKVLEMISVSPSDFFFVLTDAVFNGSELSGAQLGREIRKINRDCHIVYITSHQEIIRDILNSMTRPSGFYIKPIDEQELEILTADIYRDYLNVSVRDDDCFFINIGASMYRIPKDSIIYFEAFDKKIYVHTMNQRVGFYDSLANLEDRFGDSFIRCHKSYLINRSKIRSISFSEMTVSMENGADISISRTYKSQMREIFEQ